MRVVWFRGGDGCGVMLLKLMNFSCDFALS